MLKNLKKLREEKGVTQKQLADVISVSQQSINKYENHNIEPDIESMVRIADFFNTSVDYLIGHSDVRHKIEHVRAYDLNIEEAQLINGYRELSDRQKQTVLLVVESYQEE